MNEQIQPAAVFSNQQTATRSSQLAYVIYTSGTTGKPKGVLIEHKNVVRLLFNDRFRFEFNDQDVWSLFHSYSFDFSVWEMYGALLYGGRLVVIPRSTTLDPGEFLEVLKEQEVTVLNQTPSAFYNLMYEDLRQSSKSLKLKYVIFGGEALQPGKLKEWQKRYPGTLLVNMFGITETTVHVTYREIGETEIQEGISSIGKPIPTLSTYIMDKSRRLVVPGASGELCVGGEGISRGYLNRPELTAERFVENHYKAGEKLYKSGDLTRLLKGGQMEYLGRIDHQVQIRGFRVELGEIESRLLKHEQIRDTVALMKDECLFAYIVAEGEGEFNLSLLRKYLSEKLLDYMIPSYFVQVEKIPLTASGKVDRKTLGRYGKKISTNLEYTAPKSDMEKRIAATWQEVLHIDRVGRYDNFFDLGGNSLKAIQLNRKLNEKLELEIPIAIFYKYLTIASFVRYLSRDEAGNNQSNPGMDRSNALARAKKSKTRQKKSRRNVNKRA